MILSKDSILCITKHISDGVEQNFSQASSRLTIINIEYADGLLYMVIKDSCIIPVLTNYLLLFDLC